MSLARLIEELNDRQREAATFDGKHAIVLAGAGCGKTKTIVARAAYQISTGVAPRRIQILTFTRRAAAEIVERVKMALGDQSKGLNASTFHSWCSSIVRSNPKFFGLPGFTVVDRDDQLQMFKVLRGQVKKVKAKAATICDVYSYARNTLTSLDHVLKTMAPEHHSEKKAFASVMRKYEEKKRERNYLDYDDTLAIVANGISQYPELCQWLGQRYDYILVDEMQDTNPLQWSLLEPLSDYLSLFCVGDDAQSIYGFRGADFNNVHHFADRIAGAVTLRLEDNYRSTQEILDLSNWLLEESPLPYNKQLKAVRGKGKRPRLETFEDDQQLGGWIAEDIFDRHGDGADWNQHMILVRSAYGARPVEQALIAKDIPYRFIGGQKLLESAHVKDVISALRVVANFRDELGWIRYLTLWPGLGETTAGRIVEEVVSRDSHEQVQETLKTFSKVTEPLVDVLTTIGALGNKIGEMFRTAARMMEPILSEKFRNQEWDKRKKDLEFVANLADRHSSVLEFLEEYVLNPVYNTELNRNVVDDIVDLITIHSAKGTEREVCYVVNVSPGSFPPAYAMGDFDEVEEERRVLYVGLTRAKNELIVTRKSVSLWAFTNRPRRAMGAQDGSEPVAVTDYFFNGLPSDLVDENVHRTDSAHAEHQQLSRPKRISYGVDLS